jgi:hypothetical protein
MSSVWPASDEITLAHEGLSVRLRPSLRAASVYAQEPGFETLFRRIDQFHLATVADIITMTATDRKDAIAFLKSWEGEPLAAFVESVRSPIINLVAAFIPASEGNAPGTGELVAWPEVYRQLYHKATGWLGWTPRQAWNATPNEINQAFAGHIAMLKATGVLAPDKEEKQSDEYTPERLKQIDELGYDPAFDREGLRALKAKLARPA